MIPTTVAVDAEGKVVQVHQGYAAPDDVAELLAAARGEKQSVAADDESREAGGDE
jgi:hypothetical protein